MYQFETYSFKAESVESEESVGTPHRYSDTRRICGRDGEEAMKLTMFSTILHIDELEYGQTYVGLHATQIVLVVVVPCPLQYEDPLQPSRPNPTPQVLWTTQGLRSITLE